MRTLILIRNCLIIILNWPFRIECFLKFAFRQMLQRQREYINIGIQVHILLCLKRITLVLFSGDYFADYFVKFMFNFRSVNVRVRELILILKLKIHFFFFFFLNLKIIFLFFLLKKKKKSVFLMFILYRFLTKSSNCKKPIFF